MDWVFEDLVQYPDSEKRVDEILAIDVDKRFRELETYEGILDIMRCFIKQQRPLYERMIASRFTTKQLSTLIRNYDESRNIPKMKKRKVDVFYSMIVDEPDSMQKRRLERKSIKKLEREIVTLRGVQVPPEIALHILGFMRKNRKMLNGIGLANSTFYLLCLESFEFISIDHLNVIRVPLLVLKSVKRMRVDPSRLTKADFSYLNRHTLGVSRIVLRGKRSTGKPSHFFETLTKKRRACRELYVYDVTLLRISSKKFPNLRKLSVERHTVIGWKCPKSTVRLCRKRIKKFVCKTTLYSFPKFIAGSESITALTMRILLSNNGIEARKTLSSLPNLSLLRLHKLIDNNRPFTGAGKRFVDILRLLSSECQRLSEIEIVFRPYPFNLVSDQGYIPVDKYAKNLLEYIQELKKLTTVNITVEIKVGMRRHGVELNSELLTDLTKMVFGQQIKLHKSSGRNLVARYSLST